MHDIPAKAVFTVAATLTSGAAAVLDEQTLIPLGIFAALASFLCIAAWRVSSAVTRAVDKMDRMEDRLQALEAKIEK